jgi:hypothetical protein
MSPPRAIVYELVAEAFVEYSYKNFFECVIAMDKGLILQSFQFKSICDQVEKRKRKMFPKVNFYGGSLR